MGDYNIYCQHVDIITGSVPRVVLFTISRCWCSLVVFSGHQMYHHINKLNEHVGLYKLLCDNDSLFA